MDFSLVRIPFFFLRCPLTDLVSRHALLCQAATDLFHARQRLAWSLPGANAMSERRFSSFGP